LQYRSNASIIAGMTASLTEAEIRRVRDRMRRRGYVLRHLSYGPAERWAWIDANTNLAESAFESVDQACQAVEEESWVL
jgi:hypothetical protein